MKRHSFTLLEIVIGMVLIGVGLLSIVGVLQYASKVTSTTKSQVVAINLAREGVESIFHMRDTNWKLFSSKKDACRLASLPATGTACENIQWIGSGVYVFTGQFDHPLYTTGEHILFPVTDSLRVAENNGAESGANQKIFRMCFANNRRDYCNNFSDSLGFDNKYGHYWRQIEIKGLYDKDNTTTGGNTIACSKGSDAGCDTDTPKELRFCVKVDYVFEIARKVELCSAITNFME